MKLKLHVSEEAIASVTEALRFSSLKSDISLCGREVQNACAPELKDLLDRHQAEAIEVYVGLEQAIEQDRVLATVHLHRTFAILRVGEGAEALLGDIAASMELYAFAEDEQAIQLLCGLPFHAIAQLHSFYDNAKHQKALVLSSWRSCNLILSSDPASFVHMVFTESGSHFSLAGDLHGYGVLELQQALEVLQALKLPSGKSVPLMALRTALKAARASYSFFADHYDSYMAHVDYDLWIANLVSWQKQYSHGDGKKALELACGTANISSRMIVHGYSVDACDLSSQMLINAGRKQVKPNLYQASLTDPIPGEDYDLIFCLFDSINYLSSSTEIIRCFSEVSKALKPDGVFIFDISTLLNSLENFADNCDFKQSDRYHLVHEAWYESYHRRQISKLTCFKAHGPAFAMQTEEHQQRVYMCGELLAMIQESPLKLLAIRSSQGKTNLMHKRPSILDKQYHRLFFILGLHGHPVSE